MKMLKLLTLAILILCVCSPVYAYTPRGPITIIGWDPDDWNEDNGVVSGSGDSNDPYIISGWSINAAGHPYGIYIENALNVQYKIQDCYIYNAYTAGIYIEHGNSAIIGPVEVVNNYRGIHVNNHYVMTIFSATVENNTAEGVYAQDADGFILWSSDIRYNGKGVLLDNLWGEGWNQTKVGYCNIKSSDTRNLELVDTENVEVRNCTISGSDDMGVLVYYSDNTDFEDTFIHDNYAEGLVLYMSHYNIFTDCEFNENGQDDSSPSVDVQFSSDNRFYGNIFLDNTRQGLRLYGDSDDTTVAYNTFESNGSYGVFISSIAAANNEFHSNNFIDNNYGDTQAYDNGNNTDWSGPTGCLLGNHWDDNCSLTIWRQCMLHHAYEYCRDDYEIDGNANSVDYWPFADPIDIGY